MATTPATAAANQPPPLAGYDLFTQDRALVEAVRREGGGAFEERLVAFGEVLGGEPLEWGRLANEHPPVLRTHDRYGERIDEIEFHPAWDSLLAPRARGAGALAAVGGRAAGRARRARGGVHPARRGRGRRRLSAVDDLRRRARTARGAGAGRTSGFRG